MMTNDGDATAIWDLHDGCLYLYDSIGFCSELERTLSTPIPLDSDLYIARFMRGEADEAVIELDNAAALPGAEQHMFTHLRAKKCRHTETGEVTGARADYLVVR